MPGLCDCPDEVLLAIFTTGLLDLADLTALARSCRRLKGVAEETLYIHNRDRQASSAVPWAAVHGNIATLDKALAYKLCINQANQSLTIPGRTPLHIAVVHGEDSAVTWFLDHGANLSRVARRTPCKCSDSMTSVLHAALCFGHASTARLLISRGAPLEYPSPEPTERVIHKTTALLEASFYGLDTIVEVLVKEHGMHPQMHSGFEYYDALAHAARNANNVSTIRLLVRLGADVDGSHKWWPSSPLHLAISGRNFAVAHALLDLGARITPYECDGDVVFETMNTRECQRKTRKTIIPTPLHDAIASIRDRDQRFTPYPGFIKVETNNSWRTERIGFVQRLIELGVDINMKTYGIWKSKDMVCERWERADVVCESPLGLAAALGGETEMAMLIDAGAKVETEMLCGAWDHIGTDTKARVEKIKLLLNHGARFDSAMLLLLADPPSPISALHEILLMSSTQNLSQEQLDAALGECPSYPAHGPANTTLFHHGARVSGEDKLYSIARSLVSRLKPGIRGNAILDLDPATSSEAKALHLSMGITIDMGLSGPDQDLIFKDILRERELALAHLLLDRGLLSRPQAAEYAPAYLMLASSWGNVCVIKRLWQLPRKAPDETLCFFLVQESIALGNREAVSFFMRHGANPLQYLKPAQVSRERRLREDASAAQFEAAKIFKPTWSTGDWFDSSAYCPELRRRGRTQLLTWRHGLAEYTDAYLLPFLSPLQFAARCGHIDIVSDLLEHASQSGSSAISRCGKVYIPCVFTRANDIREMLQKKGIDCE